MPKPTANPSSHSSQGKPDTPAAGRASANSSTGRLGTVGIVGAGLMGRLLALRLSEQGWRVTLFDRDHADGHQSCGHTGAGMLSPVAELESSEPMIGQLGFESLNLWESLLGRLSQPVFFQREGTLAVAHHLDAPELSHFARMLQGKLADPTLQPWVKPMQTGDAIRWRLAPEELSALEPQLGERFRTGIFLPEEGQIDNRQLMPALAQALKEQGIPWHSNTPVLSIAPHEIEDAQQSHHFDWVLDCRGLGANSDWTQVRGVRGEIIRVHAPEVQLNRPIRLMHPRHPLYVVPRENQHYLIGATSLESEDFRPMTVQSAMELLSAAFTVHPGFAESTLQEMAVNCRPALPDNLPRIEINSGLIRVNGLYRHGFLISPKLAELVCGLIATGSLNETDAAYESLITQTETDKTEEPTYAVAH